MCDDSETLKTSFTFDEFLEEFGSVRGRKTCITDDSEQDVAEELAEATLEVFENALSSS